MAEPLSRRLPGVRFEVPPPPLDEALPRMDIAFFVGFAARGPLERAVVVESLAEFEAAYGSGIALARDAQTGATVTGLLHPCVRSFFSQGGRRCWILRVAGEGVTTSVFPVPGMLVAQRPHPGLPWRIAPALLQAGTPGSGFDAVRLAARLQPRVLRLQPVPGAAQKLRVASSGADLRPGDLLRVRDGSVRLHGRIEAIEADTGGIVLVGGGWIALRPVDGGALPPGVRIESEPEGLDSPPALPACEWGAHGQLRLRGRFALPFPQPGEVIPLRLLDEDETPAWFMVSGVDVVQAPEPGARAEVAWEGTAWREAPAEAVLAAWRASGAQRRAEVLRVQLQASEGHDAPRVSSALAMTGHAADGVFALADERRFPLVAAPAAGETCWLPLGELAGFGEGLAAAASPLPPLERDGLADFAWSLFAEPALKDEASDVLADRAEALRLVGRAPRALRGMHALFGGAAAALVDEPTLLAVPDAVHPGWSPAPPVPAWQLLPPLPEPPLQLPEGFSDCDAVPLPAPAFVRGADPDLQGGYSLHWTEVEEGASYRLEESADAGFGSTTLLHEGAARRFTVVARPAGAFHYRVRATLGRRVSAWSRGVRVEVGVRGFATLPWNSAQLLAIHRLMLRCAAARGDVLAVLTLPAGFDAPMAAAHAQALRDPAPPHDATLPPAIGADEMRALSHGALYHPWLVIRRVDAIVSFPPDGAACGQLAATALARGAWVAVANRPLRDVVALAPAALAPDIEHRQLLLDAQVNLVRSAPHGFVLSTADTLTTDAPWRPINVRRLMALLRRLALRRGTAYVFEPNGPTLRRTVERGFGAVLEQLFRRGAFAGAQPETAYRVEAGDALNTPRRRDAGQFWVELKVAPALPLSFLTVRLAREGERVVSRELH